MFDQKGFAHYLLIFLLLIGVGIAVFLIQRSTFFSPKASVIGAATLTLSPSDTSVGNDCIINYIVDLDTGGNDTDGSDAIILFDPSFVTATSVTKGTVYPSYPSTTFDNSAGKVMISGITDVRNTFAGVGTLAQISFKVNATATGNSTIRFDFDPQNLQKTTDTNVIQHGSIRDVLAETNTAQIHIDPNKSCHETASPSPTGSSSTGPTLSTSMVTTGDKKRAIVNIYWKGILHPQLNDQILITNLDSKKETPRWIYASTCSQNLSDQARPKAEGSCPFALTSQGTYQFSYNQEIAKSEQINFSH